MSATTTATQLPLFEGLPRFPRPLPRKEIDQATEAAQRFFRERGERERERVKPPKPEASK